MIRWQPERSFDVGTDVYEILASREEINVERVLTKENDNEVVPLRI